MEPWEINLNSRPPSHVNLYVSRPKLPNHLINVFTKTNSYIQEELVVNFKLRQYAFALTFWSKLILLQVRKEKLGDRIAALQQLVAPFGKVRCLISQPWLLTFLNCHSKELQFFQTERTTMKLKCTSNLDRSFSYKSMTIHYVLMETISNCHIHMNMTVECGCCRQTQHPYSWKLLDTLNSFKAKSRYIYIYICT